MRIPTKRWRMDNPHKHVVMLPLIPMPSPEDRPQLKYSSRYMTDIPRWLKVGAALAVVNFFVTCWLLWQQESPNIRHFYYFAFKHPAPFTAADHQRGDLGSKVVLIEYGDFQCPIAAHCTRRSSISRGRTAGFGCTATIP